MAELCLPLEVPPRARFLHLVHGGAAGAVHAHGEHDPAPVVPAAEVRLEPAAAANVEAAVVRSGGLAGPAPVDGERPPSTRSVTVSDGAGGERRGHDGEERRTSTGCLPGLHRIPSYDRRSSPMMTSASDRRDLHETVAALADAFPVPHPSWHGYVAEMRACVADLRRALAAAVEAPLALDLALRAVEGELDEGFAAGGAGPELATAYRRLGLLPVPAGEHLFLEEIVPTLEAAEALLVAVSLVPDAAAAFERLG